MNGQSLNLFIGKNHVEDYNAAFNLSWEADIWGKIKPEGSKQNAVSTVV